MSAVDWLCVAADDGISNDRMKNERPQKIALTGMDGSSCHTSNCCCSQLYVSLQSNLVPICSSSNLIIVFVL